MRRPTLCSSATTRSEDGPGEGRLARVKRMLTGSLLGGRPGNSQGPTQRIFGLRLEELPLTATTGVPQVAVRLCCYIERYGLKCGGLFRLSAGNPKLVERLRASFDQTGDADLETAGDVATVAALLKLWLRELPEAVVCTHVALELLDIQDKLQDDTKWREAVCQTLGNLPERNSALLRYLLHFLHHYEIHGQCRHHVPGGLATVFAPLLMRIAGAQLNVQQQLTTRLIQDCQLLYQDNRLQVDQALKAALPAEPALTAEAVSAPPKQHQHRKRKERHESFSSQTQDRKVIRSNSEERPFEDGGVHPKDSIRRVSSHEDFSLVKGRSINKKNSGKNFLSDLTSGSAGHGVRTSGLPLHERNAGAQPPSKSGAAAGNTENEATSDAMSCVEMFEDSEHERRRSSERFSRAVTPRGRRNMARRRHQVTHKKSPPEEQDGSGSSKENEDQDGLVPSSRLIHQAVSLTSSTSDEDSSQDASSNSSSTHSFLQLHTQERERSPSPAPSPCTPPLDLSTLHQQVDCSEPLTSFSNWSFAHRQPEEAVVSRQMMMSPRSSLALTHRDHNGISAPVDDDTRVKQLSKQVNSLKKKLKRYEEDFEHEFGFRPSHADKMGNKEVKKICAELSKLRKELKQLKEDPHAPVLPHTESIVPMRSEKSSARHREKKSANLEEKLQEVEKHLEEKRTLAGRPENLEELTKEQILDEKIAVQKALLYLEGMFGRPVTKGERELMHPLYDRYRALKRLVIRSGSSKLKDSMSELATILEHETMDFTSSPPSLSAQEESPESPAAPDDSIEVSDTSHALWENLHSLSLSELLNQQRVTREEKKRLRRSLREFEEEFQRRTGKKLQREDRLSMSATYVAYKQAKAKLRLLEALVTKQT